MDDETLTFLFERIGNDVRDLMRCKQVCKQWKNLLDTRPWLITNMPPLVSITTKYTATCLAERYMGEMCVDYHNGDIYFLCEYKLGLFSPHKNTVVPVQLDREFRFVLGLTISHQLRILYITLLNKNQRFYIYAIDLTKNTLTTKLIHSYEENLGPLISLSTRSMCLEDDTHMIITTYDGCQIERLNLDNGQITYLVGSTMNSIFTRIYGVCCDPVSRDIIITSAQGIHIFSDKDRKLTTYEGPTCLGVCVDKSGNVYTCDIGNDLINVGTSNRHPILIGIKNPLNITFTDEHQHAFYVSARNSLFILKPNV